MSLPKMTTAVDNISKLDTRPNAVNGLTADELKAKFDKAPEDIKRFLNEVLIPALDGAITPDALGAVPKTRKVNGKTLDADVTLDAASIDYAGAISGAANVKAALDSITANLSGLTAEDVQYQGNIGAAQAFSVAEALALLAIGVPLDMSSDYAASGAASVQAWATMAKSGDATKYRVAAGRYSISDKDSEIGYLITIIDTPGVTYRTVWVASVTDFAFVDCYTVDNPADGVKHIVEFDTETKFLEINGQNMILPAYTAADAGKNLIIGTDGTPRWGAVPALPDVGAADNGKFLRVVSGAWAAQALTNVAEVGA